MAAGSVAAFFGRPRFVGVATGSAAFFGRPGFFGAAHGRAGRRLTGRVGAVIEMVVDRPAGLRRGLKLQKLKGELVDRARAEALVFRLARETRDAWVNWPARAAALIAAVLGLDTATLQKVLEAHVRAHLDELSEARLGLG